MAQLQSVGPAHLYVSTGQTLPTQTSFGVEAITYPRCDEIRYLGTCEFAPKILVNPRYLPISASIAGGSEAVPYDKFWMGEDALISGTLTMWNELVYEQVVSRPNASTGIPGKDSGRGRMMFQEGLCYSLWLQFPRSSKTVFSNAYVPAGYRFPAAWLGGPEEMAIGTGANKRAILFYGLAAYERKRTILGNSHVQYQSHFLLYDSLMTYLPTIPPTTVDGSLTTCGIGDVGGGEPGFGNGGWSRPA